MYAPVKVVLLIFSYRTVSSDLHVAESWQCCFTRLDKIAKFLKYTTVKAKNHTHFIGANEIFIKKFSCRKCSPNSILSYSMIQEIMERGYKQRN